MSIKVKSTTPDDFGIRTGTVQYWARDEQSQAKHLQVGASWKVAVHGVPEINGGAYAEIGTITRIGRSVFDLGAYGLYHTGGGTVASHRAMAQQLACYVIDDAQRSAGVSA